MPRITENFENADRKNGLLKLRKESRNENGQNRQFRMK